MRNYDLKFKVALIIALAGVFWILPTAEAEATGQCFCYMDLSAATGAKLTELKAGCFDKPVSECAPEEIDKQFSKCSYKDSENACNDAYTKWQADLQAEVSEKVNYAQSANSKFIPQCALEDELSPQCRDVSVFVMLLINIARYLFGIVGALALLFFVYGGFVFILSEGNSESTKKGFEILKAAVLGLIVTFGAYLLVSFLGETLGVQGGFMLK